MTTIGQTQVTITIEEFGNMLERAAQMGIEAERDHTVVPLTVKGIAGTLVYETALAGQLKPAPTGPVYRGSGPLPRGGDGPF